MDRLQVGWRDADYTKLQYNPVGTLLYQYDPEGNIVRRTAADQSYTVYTWDHRNRLIAVTDFDDSDTELTRVEYHYDAFDQLVGRKVFLSGGSTADESEVFVYEDGQVVLQFDGSGNDDLLAEDLSHRYLWGPMVDQILAEETVNNLTDAGQNEVLWPLADHLGTVRDRVDSSGTVVEHADYDAFGRRLDAPAVDAVFGWTGRYRDPLTGLQYNTARWYNPETGRWMSEDPIGFSARDPNLHRYVENTPTMYADPDGLQLKRIDLNIGDGLRAGIDRGPQVYGGFEIHVLNSRGKEVAKIDGSGHWCKTHRNKTLLTPTKFKQQYPNAIKGLRKTLRKQAYDAARAGWRTNRGVTKVGAARISTGVLLVFAMGTETANALDALAKDRRFTKMIECIEKGDARGVRSYSGLIEDDLIIKYNSVAGHLAWAKFRREVLLPRMEKSVRELEKEARELEQQR